MLKFHFYLIVIIFVSLSISCTKEIKKTADTTKEKNAVTYAQGFAIVTKNGTKKLLIKSAYLNTKDVFEYHIQKKTNQANISNNSQIIKVPIDKIVVTSTTHIPMLELLHQENTIIGFPHASYISSEKTSQLVSSGKITEIGKEEALNTEILLDLQPELVVGYSISSADASLTTLENAGIPVIYNGDWLEETPLGRAEWIKFFGLLFDKEKQADSIFTIIEHNYINAKKLALQATKKTTILSGAVMSKDIWSLPAGNSFISQFLQDANVTYLWENSEGKGSLSLSFESVFDKGKDADFWIAPGYFSTKKQLLKNNQLYANFKAFKNNTIYTPSTKKGKTGGVIYYEMAPTRPDLVLKDIIKITNPKILPGYTLTFFEQMK